MKFSHLNKHHCISDCLLSSMASNRFKRAKDATAQNVEPPCASAPGTHATPPSYVKQSTMNLTHESMLIVEKSSSIYATQTAQ